MVIGMGCIGAWPQSKSDFDVGKQPFTIEFIRARRVGALITLYLVL